MERNNIISSEKLLRPLINKCHIIKKNSKEYIDEILLNKILKSLKIIKNDEKVLFPTIEEELIDINGLINDIYTKESTNNNFVTEENKKKINNMLDDIFHIAINNAKFDSNKERMKSKLEKLKYKQGEIKDKQRKSIDKKILKIYNKDRRKNKLSNKAKALEEYKKYRDELINVKRNQSSIEFINKITNKIYDIRNIPLELQIATVKRLQKKQGTIQDTFMKNKANRFMQTTNKYQARHMAA